MEPTSTKPIRNFISPELIPEVYRISKNVYEGKLTPQEGVRKSVGNNRMNASSASDYIYVFRYLMQGKQFTRTLNAESMDYYFDQISKDYKSDQLTISLSSLMKHIEYAEPKQQSHMHQMRAIHNKYLSKTIPLQLITDLNQLEKNITTFEYYLTEGNENEKFEIINLIKRGTCFIAYSIGKELRFAPSRFLGYINNSLEKHKTSYIDGRDTNRAISAILKSKLSRNNKMENSYLNYCESLGIEPNAKDALRKYWTLNLPNDFNNESQMPAEFPEGRIVERTHKARERNYKVIEVAKNNFKKKHGKLFCQVCKFDFVEIYGKIGEDFIEGHHTIAVSEMY